MLHIYEYQRLFKEKDIEHYGYRHITIFNDLDDPNDLESEALLEHLRPHLKYRVNNYLPTPYGEGKIEAGFQMSQVIQYTFRVWDSKHTVWKDFSFDSGFDLSSYLEVS